MIDKRLILSAVIAVIVVTVLSGLFDGEVFRSSASPNLNTGRGGGDMTAATGPSADTQAMMMAQAPSAMAPSPLPAVPQGPMFLPIGQQQDVQQPLMDRARQVAGMPPKTLQPQNGQQDGQAAAKKMDVAILQEVPNFLPSNIQLSEAHWQGLEGAHLTAELRQKLKYPKGLQGVLVDEVTLNAARSGLLAGDVITAIGNVSVVTLEQFQMATRMVKDMPKAEVTALRKAEMGANGRFAMRRVNIFIKGDPEMGIAQMESAPMIVPGDLRPHPPRGACTNCHSIGKGFELTPDPDLINLPPPAIAQDVADKGVSPHRDRGPCVACHLITP